VYVDGSLVPLTTLNGNTTVGLPSYTSPLLGATADPHTVELKQMTSSVVAFDFIQIDTVTNQPAGTYDTSDTNWAYNGWWLSLPITGAYGNTLEAGLTPGGTAAFPFMGRGFTMTYLSSPGYGSIGVYVDGAVSPVVTLNTNAAFAFHTYTYAGPPLALGNHTVTFKQVGAPGTLVIIDKLVITP
jgi:hypothetical protein